MLNSGCKSGIARVTIRNTNPRFTPEARRVPILVGVTRGVCFQDVPSTLAWFQNKTHTKTHRLQGRASPPEGRSPPRSPRARPHVRRATWTGDSVGCLHGCTHGGAGGATVAQCVAFADFLAVGEVPEIEGGSCALCPRRTPRIQIRILFVVDPYLRSRNSLLLGFTAHVQGHM